MDTLLYLLFIQNQSLMTLSGRQMTFWASLILDSSLLLHGRAFISDSIYSSLNLILVGNVLPLLDLYPVLPRSLYKAVQNRVLVESFILFKWNETKELQSL